MEELRRQFEALEKEHEDLLSTVNSLLARIKKLEDEVPQHTLEHKEIQFEER